MNTLDIYLLVHLAIEVIFEVFYLAWQFDRIDVDEKVVQVIIAILNTFETTLLIVSRFRPYTGWGTFALAAWYVLNTIMLCMQFALADWGWRHKVQDVLWISLYVCLFLHDVHGIHPILEILGRISEPLMAFGEKIDGTFWGDVIKSIILFLVKAVWNLFATVKSDD